MDKLINELLFFLFLAVNPDSNPSRQTPHIILTEGRGELKEESCRASVSLGPQSVLSRVLQAKSVDSVFEISC